ncbi:hypothetical protein ACHAPT_008320 [Fusarium lateritium]
MPASAHANTEATVEAAVSVPDESRAKLSASVEEELAPTNQASDQASSKVDDTTTSLDLWLETYEELDSDTRKWVGDVSGVTNVKDSTQELVDLVRKSEDEYKDQTPKITVGNRQILWRDYAERVVSWLTTIGDIAITFAPAPSSAAWSAVKVLLKANVSQCKDLVAILDCTDTVLCLARRGRIYEEVYLGELPLTDPQKDLRQQLVGIYKMCLEFLAYMDARFKRSQAGQFFDALLDPGQGGEKVSKLRKLEEELSWAAETCETEKTHARSEEHRKLLQSLQEPLKRIDDRVTAVLEKLEEKERQDALNYISKIPVGIHHTEKHDARTRGTCGWLISHSKFREWEDSMGTGKSFLSSMVIDRYRVDKGVTSQWSNQHDEAFAYFYCSRSDPARQDIRSILRSYIRQLSEIPRRSESIHRASYNLAENRKRVQQDIELQDCKSALVEMINSYPRTTLVLDALDECDSNTRQQLATFLKDLVKESTHLLKVFVASRKETDIETYLGSFQGPQMLVQISTSDNKGGIKKFVNDEMAKFEKNWPFMNPDLKICVEDTLVEKRDGMQWEQLKECSTSAAITERLQELPETLSGAYDELYLRHSLRGSERLMLQRAVRWVMCAHEPLDSYTLLSAIRVESEKVDGERRLQKSDLTEQTLESVCRHLVVRDPNLGVWKFPHASAAEYFGDKDEAWVKDAQAEGKRTLTILQILDTRFRPTHT